MAKEKKRLADYGTLERRESLPNLTEIEGLDVTVTEVEWLTGAHGEFAIITAVLDTGEVKRVTSGGMIVVDALKDAEEKQALPLPAKFSRPGRAWLVE